MNKCYSKNSVINTVRIPRCTADLWPCSELNTSYHNILVKPWFAHMIDSLIKYTGYSNMSKMKLHYEHRFLGKLGNVSSYKPEI